SAVPAPSLAPGAISDNEYLLLEQALASINMTRSDLAFRKEFIGDGFWLDAVQRAVSDPVSLVEWDRAWDEFLREPGSVGSIVNRASTDLGAIRKSGEQASFAPTDETETNRYYRLPASWREPVMKLDLALSTARNIMENKVLAGLTVDEIAFLHEFLPTRFGEADNDDAGEDMYQPSEEFNKIVSKFDLVSLLEASSGVADAVDAAVSSLGSVINEADFKGPILIRGLSGAILVGTPADDSWYFDILEKPSIFIEPGGDDTYSGGVAVAGDIENENYPLVSVVLDFSGNDRYSSKGSRSCASGVLGIAQLVDLEGNDIYESGNFSQGVGCFGSGILIDKSGSDFYDGGVFTQGAGAIGVGFLSDENGSDSYRAWSYAQGAGYVKGFGLLCDRMGSDVYVARGPISRFENDNGGRLSRSQGYGSGSAPYAIGGFGILNDRTGDDAYFAEIYSQGSGLWASIGSLIDDDGNDRYQAMNYAQGSGVKNSNGILLDRAGDDGYFSSGYSQGSGFDYSLGWLIDESGNDSYTSRGPARGVSRSNGIGILLERAGDDGYFGFEFKPVIGPEGEEVPDEFGTIGIFIDEGGFDTYSESEAGDGLLWTTSTHGAGLDADESWWQDVIGPDGLAVGRKLVLPGV
ncbi:MAG: hypothetical protein ABIC40_05075, partial [bacterium]